MESVSRQRESVDGLRTKCGNERHTDELLAETLRRMDEFDKIATWELTWDEDGKP